MIGDAPYSVNTGVPGWETEAEEAALIDLTRRYVPEQNGVIVELGGEYGRSASQFAYAAKDKQGTRIVTVDLFPDNHHIAGQHGGLFQVWQQNIAESGVAGANLYMIPVRGVSWEVGNNWNEEIDLLFIDAGHTFEEVSKDISAWLRHVKPGGIVVFHDVAKNDDAHPLHFEVKRAIDEWYEKNNNEWERYDAPDSLLYFVRTQTAEKAEYEHPKVEKRPSHSKSKSKTGKKKGDVIK